MAKNLEAALPFGIANEAGSVFHDKDAHNLAVGIKCRWADSV
jgi:hypothetical protein